jgi:hypothetical protein
MCRGGGEMVRLVYCRGEDDFVEGGGVVGGRGGEVVGVVGLFGD